MKRNRKGRLRRSALFALAAVTALPLMSCGGPPEGVVVKAKVAVIGQSEGIKFWEFVEQGAMDAAEELGYEVEYHNASDITDIAGQEQLIKDAITNGAEVIVVAPNDPTLLNDALVMAEEKNIPVLTIDADVTDMARRSAYIGTSNASAGAIAGRQAASLIENLDDRAAIIMHSDTATSALQRVGGFQGAFNGALNQRLAMEMRQKMEEQARQRAQQNAAEAQAAAEGAEGAPEGAQGAPEGAQGAPANAQGAPEGAQGPAAQQGPPADAQAGAQSSGTNFVSVVRNCNGNLSTAKALAKDILENNPEVKVIYTTNERSTVGVCEAIEEAGKVGEVHVIGFNSNDSEIYYINQDILAGTMVQNPYNMGYLGVYYAGKCLSSGNVPANIDTGAAFVTKDNLSEPEIQLLLDPASYASKGGNSNG